MKTIKKFLRLLFNSSALSLLFNNTQKILKYIFWVLLPILVLYALVYILLCIGMFLLWKLPIRLPIPFFNPFFNAGVDRLMILIGLGLFLYNLFSDTIKASQHDKYDDYY